MTCPHSHSNVELVLHDGSISLASVTLLCTLALSELAHAQDRPQPSSAVPQPAPSALAQQARTSASFVQPPSTQAAATIPVFTLEEALQHAVANYPSVKAALEQVNVTSAGVDVARSAYLPRLDSLWQTNRATVNNITGLLLPQSVIPGISGPPLPSASGQSAWGSVAGALFSWEPFDFGLRDAGVRGAEAAVTRARADESLTQLEVQSAVGCRIPVGRAAPSRRWPRRARTWSGARSWRARPARSPTTSCGPGAEASRADAERAAAETRAILARRTVILAQATLARVLGVPSGLVDVNATSLLARRAVVRRRRSRRQRASARPGRDRPPWMSRARRKTSWRRPIGRACICSRRSSHAAAARRSDGRLEGGAAGLGLERDELGGRRAGGVPQPLRLRQPACTARVGGRHARAPRPHGTTRRCSRSRTSSRRPRPSSTPPARWPRTRPIQLTAARQSEAQARARYEAGLASIVEVADTQSLLAQAEYQDAAARVDVWRALLARGGGARRHRAVRRPRPDAGRSALGHVVDSRRASASDHGPRRRHRASR